MKKIYALLLSVIMLFALASCTSSNPTPTPSAAPSANIPESTAPSDSGGGGTDVPYFVIGAQTYSMAEEASSWMIQGMERALADYEGVDGKVVVYDPEADIAKQVAGVEEFISAEVDGIIISSVDSIGIVPALQSAAAAGITVVPFDLQPDWAEAPCVVLADDHKGGYLAGKFLCDYLVENGIESGTILVQKTRPSITACVWRAEGYEQAIAEYPQFVCETFLADPGGRAGWLAATENMLQAHPDAIAVCCFDGDSSMAGALAVESQGRTDDVVVTGYFPGSEVCQACVDGRMIGVVDSDAEGMAYTAMVKCLDILTGKTPDALITTDVTFLDQAGCQQWLDTHIN